MSEYNNDLLKYLKRVHETFGFCRYLYKLKGIR